VSAAGRFNCQVGFRLPLGPHTPFSHFREVPVHNLEWQCCQGTRDNDDSGLSGRFVVKY